MIIYYNVMQFPDAAEECPVNSEQCSLSRDIVYVSSNFNAVVFIEPCEIDEWNQIIVGHANVYFSYFLDVLYGKDVHTIADLEKDLYHVLFNNHFSYFDLHSLFSSL